MCRTKNLYSEGELIIEQCQDCKRIGIQLRNILFTFELGSFLSYVKKIFEIDFYTDAIPFEDGSFQLILETEDKNMSYSLEYVEFEMLKKGLQMAILMIEADIILNDK